MWASDHFVPSPTDYPLRGMMMRRLTEEQKKDTQNSPCVRQRARPTLATTYMGHDTLWPRSRRLRPRSIFGIFEGTKGVTIFGQRTLAIVFFPSLANNNFGQNKNQVWPNELWPTPNFSFKGRVGGASSGGRWSSGPRRERASEGKGPEGWGFHTTTRRRNAHIRGSRRTKTPPKFHEKTPEREKSENGSGRGKTSRNCGWSGARGPGHGSQGGWPKLVSWEGRLAQIGLPGHQNRPKWPC